jgi:crotonobetainyl-CoA:carnitine CoA-transferase CaiB-like acyl-CoA transferase
MKFRCGVEADSCGADGNKMNGKKEEPLSDAVPASGPLAGLRVTEFGSFIAAPLAARVFADFGAEVIKIETPDGGDQNREWGMKEGGASYSWYAMARNKKSVTCDLHSPRGQDLARQLAVKSDIVVENFRPGRMAQWGLGYEQLRALHPKLVMVHISAYGQTGPYSNRAGFGSIAEAMSGVRYLMAEPGRPSLRFGFPLADSVAALNATFSAIVALRHAERTGEGQEIDVALCDTVMQLLDDAIMESSATGIDRKPSGATSDRVVPSGAYPCADGHSIVIGGNSDSTFRRLMTVVGRGDLGDNAEYRTNAGRVQQREEIDRLISAWTQQNTVTDVMSILNANGIPAGSINSPADILRDSHFLERQSIVNVLVPEVGRALAMQGVVPGFSKTPGAIRWTGPALGAHNREIYLGLLGMEEQEFDLLHQEGVI